MQLPNDTYVFDCYEMQPARRLLTRDGVRVPLSPKAFDILFCLVQRAGHVVTKEELLEAVWPEVFVSENNLTQHIFWLRKAFLDRAEIITTVPSRGYELTATVSVRTEVTAVQPAAAAVPGDHNGAATPPSGGSSEERTLPLPSKGSRKSAALAAAVILGIAGVAWLAAPPFHVVVSETKRLTSDGYAKDVWPVPMISDGTFLYFTEVRDNRTALARVPIAGGDVSVTAAPFPGAVFADYSDAQHALLIGSVWQIDDDRPILIEKPIGSAPVPLGELRGHDGSFSPDGTRIAFAKGHLLYIAQSDGSAPHSIAGSTGIVFQPRWSPDGKVLRYSRSLGSMQKQLWEVAPDGSNDHQLFVSSSDKDQVCCGNWTADGRYFFYMSGDSPANSLWVVPTGEGWPWNHPQPQRLSLSVADMWTSPLPSADGRKVWTIGEHLQGNLVRVDPTTHEVKEFLGGISAEGVSFSPNGEWIAYTAYPEGTLWVSRLDGSQKRRLTDPPFLSRFPKWSPDGRSLVFLAGKADTTWRLYVLTLATGAIRSVIANEQANEGTPSWSPDGRRIAFGRLINYGSGRDPDLSIEVVDLEHGSRITLHNSTGLWTPRWSPDGRYFAAVTEDNQTLKLFDTQSQQWSDLAHVGIDDVTWAPDSTHIFFDTSLGTKPLIYRVSVPDGKLEQWADLSGIPRGGFFRPWLGMSPQGDPIFLKDRSIREVYRVSLDY